MRVGDLKLYLLHKKIQEIKKPEIHNFFADNHTVGFQLGDEGEDDQCHFAPPYATLDEEGWSVFSNIYYEDIAPSFKRIHKQYKDSFIFSVANNTLLSILLAYDKKQKEALISAAHDLAEWILKEAPSEILSDSIRTINLYQVLLRTRELEDSERVALVKIANNSMEEERVRVGAFLLLGNQESAEYHFESMDDSTKENFSQWPIFRFWIKKRIC